MILDTLDNAAKYEALHKNFKKAFDFIRKNNLEAMEPGRYEIEGDEIFALVQAYSTQPAGVKDFEAHRNYIDIQYMITGSEMMGYTTEDNLTVTAEYDPEKDIERYSYTAATECEVGTGSFAVFFPEDPHMPGCIIKGQEACDIKKLVLKIRK